MEHGWSGGRAGAGAEPGTALLLTGLAAPLFMSAQLQRRRKTSWADIPSPGTEPRAPFPSGAQPSLWFCSKTLTRV